MLSHGILSSGIAEENVRLCGSGCRNWNQIGKHQYVQIAGLASKTQILVKWLLRLFIMATNVNAY